jgi:L-cysteine desulfidase
MAIEDGVASPLEGIIDQDIDQTIRNLALIGNNGMSETDKVVLDIIINK